MATGFGYGFLDIMGGVDQVKDFIKDPDYIRTADGTIIRGKKKEKEKKVEGLKRLIEASRQKVSISYLAGMIKKKYGKSVSAEAVMDIMAEEGYHADDDYPDVVQELESIGVEVIEKNLSKSESFIKSNLVEDKIKCNLDNKTKISDIMKLKGLI